MRWVTGSGRPSALLDDPQLDDWVANITGHTYRPPGSKLAGANSELARLDYDECVDIIDSIFKEGVKFYSNEPFLHLYMDLWSSRSKLPFLGLEASFSQPWAASTDVRCGVHLGLVNLPGRHGGEEVAIATADHLRETFPIIKPGPIHLPADSFKADSDLSALFLCARTDSGGGIPAAGRRLGMERGSCYLHEGDLWILWAYCVHKEKKKLTEEEKMVFALVKKVREMVSHFSNSSQRDEAYAAACLSVREAFKETVDYGNYLEEVKKMSMVMVNILPFLYRPIP
jgi:hypothetical protein